MFAQAARRMGYRVAVWDPDPDAPGHRAADYCFSTPFSDDDARRAFSDSVQAVTLEWENIPVDLCAWLEERQRVRPRSEVLRIIQNRIDQKRYLQTRALPVPAFTAIRAPGDLEDALRVVGLPAICKTATAGYDGKGQWLIRQPGDTASVQAALQSGMRPGMSWIVEALVPFERELSVLVVRSDSGEVRTYPAAHNLHEQGILRMTQVPADLPPSLAEEAAQVAVRAVDALQGTGVFCVELFQLADRTLRINEIAPRPHNSGHYTLDACSVSQFEQQVRILCGLPLGEARLLSPAAMVNLLGNEAAGVAGAKEYQALLSVPGAVPHFYGKRAVRAGRKMGHVTFLADQADLAVERARRFLKTLS
jgi:5-(carboxyamino)imidazole ribonucleotide synthase